MTQSGQTTHFTKRLARAAMVKAMKAQGMSATDHLLTTDPPVLNAEKHITITHSQKPSAQRIYQ
tara:strand:+ start:519 stop:710 length:192 start_codon:yes stop_codon:yes gene_type:complete